MNTVLLQLHLLGFSFVVTPWKLIGYAGVLLFTGRWFVQMLASRRRGKPTVPTLFWYMSISGSVLLLSYFVFGKNDSVGVLSNLFPLFVSMYNLSLDIKSRQHPVDGDNADANS